MLLYSLYIISFNSQFLFAISFECYRFSSYDVNKLNYSISKTTLKMLHNICIISSFYFLQKDVPFIPQTAQGKEEM